VARRSRKSIQVSTTLDAPPAQTPAPAADRIACPACGRENARSRVTCKACRGPLRGASGAPIATATGGPLKPWWATWWGAIPTANLVVAAFLGPLALLDGLFGVTAALTGVQADGLYKGLGTLLWLPAYLVIRAYHDRPRMRHLPLVALAGLLFVLLAFALRSLGA
jgi:hypothetical protein